MLSRVQRRGKLERASSHHAPKCQSAPRSDSQPTNFSNIDSPANKKPANTRSALDFHCKKLQPENSSTEIFVSTGRFANSTSEYLHTGANILARCAVHLRITKDNLPTQRLQRHTPNLIREHGCLPGASGLRRSSYTWRKTHWPNPSSALTLLRSALRLLEVWRHLAIACDFSRSGLHELSPVLSPSIIQESTGLVV